MTFMITLPETKPQNTKTAVAPELIRICPNQPCNPSVLSPSCIIIKFPCQMTFKEYECYVPYKVEQDMHVRIYIST